MSSKERVRHVDVGARIGRKLEGRDEDKNKIEQNFADLHMRRVELRNKGDEELRHAGALEQESIEISLLDTVPCLPGQWTLQLHDKVMQKLEESRTSLDAAEAIYKQAGAKDKLASTEVLRDRLGSLKLKTVKLREWSECLAEAELEVQDAARLGLPWGEKHFVCAREKLEEAKRRLKEAGEDGPDESSGRLKPKSLILNKFDLRLLKVRRECERRRAKVSQHIQQTSNPNAEKRQSAVRSLGQVGRKPVPCGVDFFGNLEELVDERRWNESEGRGDEEVVRAVECSLLDTDGQIRQLAMEGLPSVCKEDDITVMDKIASLLQDQSVHVRMKAMQTISSIAARDAVRAYQLLCDRLADPDTTVRGVAVKTISQLLRDSEDQDSEQYNQIIAH
eukprot:759001-Hanusia_phi.AAC.7